VKGQINLFVFYSIHYPKPEKEALLIESMHNYAELMEQQQGIVFVAPYAFTDPERGTLIGISIWESEEAFEAALPTLQNARKAAPSGEWESNPPEVYMLSSAR
jgi:hypothetical protein